MKSISIKVLRPEIIGKDALGEDICELVPEPDEVLVLTTPGKVAELDATRPEGVLVTWTIHFPKDYVLSLRDCWIEMSGNRYRVIGDPQPYMPENTPGLFNRPVEVEVVDG